MKKYAIRVICFALIFALLFQTASQILSKRWNNLYARNLDFKNSADGTVDVLCFGTSEMWASIDPMVAYQAEGVTGYNFATTYKSAITTYYQVQQAFSYHTPKVVMCDFAALYEDSLPGSSESVEALYCKVLDCLTDPKMKLSMIRDILSLDDTRSFFTWWFPLLRYHSLWAELSKDNFLGREESAADYVRGTKGALLESHLFMGDPIELTPETWESEPEEKPFSEISTAYYEKMIKFCQARGVQVVYLVPPMISKSKSHAEKRDQENAWFAQQGVTVLDYNNYEQVVERLHMDMTRDYYDAAHLNVPGSIKFTAAVAADLKEAFDLPDHREDPACDAEWKGQWSEFALKAITEARSAATCVDAIRDLGLTAEVTIGTNQPREKSATVQDLTAKGIDVPITFEGGDGSGVDVVTVRALDSAGNVFCETVIGSDADGDDSLAADD